MMDPEDMHTAIIDLDDRLAAVEKRKPTIRVCFAQGDDDAVRVARKLGRSRDGEIIPMDKDEMTALVDPYRVFVLKPD